MIVSEKNVSDALAYLGSDPHPLANAQKALMFAEKQREEQFAALYLKTGGTVKERECHVLTDPLYGAAKTAEIEAQTEVVRHKARTKAAEMLIEIYRTEAANVRAAEKIR